jgi:hypothetical protein
MNETKTDDILQVTTKENNLLTAIYSIKEVRKATFQMENNKALIMNKSEATWMMLF